MVGIADVAPRSDSIRSFSNRCSPSGSIKPWINEISRCGVGSIEHPGGICHHKRVRAATACAASNLGGGQAMQRAARVNGPNCDCDGVAGYEVNLEALRRVEICPGASDEPVDVKCVFVIRDNVDHDAVRELPTPGNDKVLRNARPPIGALPATTSFVQIQVAEVRSGPGSSVVGGIATPIVFQGAVVPIGPSTKAAGQALSSNATCSKPATAPVTACHSASVTMVSVKPSVYRISMAEMMPAALPTLDAVPLGAFCPSTAKTLQPASRGNAVTECLLKVGFGADLYSVHVQSISVVRGD